MAPFDISYTTSYLFTIVSIAISSIIFELFNVERSLKVIQNNTIKKLAWYCTVTMALSYIVSEIQYSTSNNGVTGHLRSLKVAPIDKSYQSAIVDIALLCVVFELCDVE